jgi:hypothetical protein
MLALITCAGAARAQMWNFTDGDAPGRTERQTAGKPKDTTVFPLSSNTIVGRVQWVDTKGALAVILVGRGAGYTESSLVAREDDCTVRAVLRPIKMKKPSSVIACRVTHGTARPGMEIVLPTLSLLKSSTLALKSNEAPAAKTAVK